MDLERLAGSAVGLVIAFGEQVAGQVGERVVSSLAQEVYGLVERRLSGDQSAEHVLTAVREKPDDQQSAQELTRLLLEIMASDPAFAEAVDERVQQATRAGVVHNVVPATVTIGKMRRSHFSMGPMTVNNTRQVRFAFGGIGIAVVIGLIVLLLSVLSGGDDPDLSDRTSASAAGGVTADGALVGCIVSQDRPPFSTTAQDGTFSGIEPDLLALVAEQLDVELSLVAMNSNSAPTCELMADGYGYDGERPSETSSQLADGFTYSVPYLVTEPWIGVTAMDVASVGDLASVGATVAIGESADIDYSLGDALRNAGLTVQIGLGGYSDLGDGATTDAGLRSGEADAIADGWIFGVDFAATYGYRLVDLSDAAYTEGPRSRGFAVAEDRVDEINNALTALIDDGAISSLFDARYGTLPGWLPLDGNRPGGTPTASETTAQTETMTAAELSQEGNLLVIDDDGFAPDTIVVQDDSCDTGGCSATFDVVNEGTSTHTFTIDDSHFTSDWLDEYGPVDWELAPGETAGGVYVTDLPGDADDLNPEVLEFHCRIHPNLTGQFVRAG